MNSDPVKTLNGLLRSVRRRALLLLTAQSLVHALCVGCIVGGLVVAIGRVLRFSWPLIGGIILAIVATSAAWFMRHRAIRRMAYLRSVDDHFDAAGRLIVAADFLGQRHTLNAYQRLALVDAATWIKTRRSKRLPWTWPSRWPAMASFLVLFAIVAPGCQKPSTPPAKQRAPEQRGAITVAPPDGGSTTPPALPVPPPPAGSTDNPFGKPAPRPEGVTYGADEFPSDRGGGNRAGRNSSASAGPGGGGSAAQGGPGARGQDFNKPGGGGSGGSGAGTSGGPKQADPRGVQAAKKDVEASGGNGVGKPSGPQRVGTGSKPGEQFANGAAPGATTRPAAIVGFDGVEIDEMTLERLPPEQRERIRQYNENLRKLREQQAPPAAR